MWKPVCCHRVFGSKCFERCHLSILYRERLWWWICFFIFWWLYKCVSVYIWEACEWLYGCLYLWILFCENYCVHVIKQMFLRISEMLVLLLRENSIKQYNMRYFFYLVNQLIMIIMCCGKQQQRICQFWWDQHEELSVILKQNLRQLRRQHRRAWMCFDLFS